MLLGLLTMGSAALSDAQTTDVVRARIDSVVNPRRVAGHESMRFNVERLDLGTVSEEAVPPVCTFVWRNVGSTSLVVTRVVTSCGCVTAEFDRQPVPPGGEGRIEAVYHPQRHPGHFDRRIFVYTQLSAAHPTAILSLTGFVEPAKEQAYAYPVAVGKTLRLRYGEVRFDGTHTQIERIVCLNTGDVPRTVQADSLLTPPYIAVSCEPEYLEPNAEGDIVIRFLPDRAPEKLPDRLPLMLTGGAGDEAVAPRQRTVLLRFGTVGPETE